MLGCGFEHMGKGLGMWAGILAPGRTFGHEGGHFSARARICAILVYQSDLGSILTLRLIKSPSVQSPFEFFLLDYLSEKKIPNDFDAMYF